MNIKYAGVTKLHRSLINKFHPIRFISVRHSTLWRDVHKSNIWEYIARLPRGYELSRIRNIYHIGFDLVNPYSKLRVVSKCALSSQAYVRKN